MRITFNVAEVGRCESTSTVCSSSWRRPFRSARPRCETGRRHRPGARAAPVSTCPVRATAETRSAERRCVGQTSMSAAASGGVIDSGNRRTPVALANPERGTERGEEQSPEAGCCGRRRHHTAWPRGVAEWKRSAWCPVLPARIGSSRRRSRADRGRSPAGSGAAGLEWMNPQELTIRTPNTTRPSPTADSAVRRGPVADGGMPGVDSAIRRPTARITTPISAPLRRTPPPGGIGGEQPARGPAATAAPRPRRRTTSARRPGAACRGTGRRSSPAVGGADPSPPRSRLSEIAVMNDPHP